MRSLFIALLLALFLAPICRAQALADRVPAEALIYVGWNGTDVPAAEYAQSHLKAVLDASQVREFLQNSLPALQHLIERKNPDAGPLFADTLNALTIMAKCPSAFYFAPPAANAQNPLPTVALLCDAGSSAQNLVNSLNNLLAQSPQLPLHCTMNGSLVILADTDVAAPTSSLSQTAAFKAAMAELDKDPVAAAYVDVHGMAAYIDSLPMPPRPRQMFTNLRNNMHLDRMQIYAATTGYAGKNWSMQSVLHTDGEAATIFTEVTPISAELLKLVPETATDATASNLDLNHVVTAVLASLRNADPGMRRQVDQTVSQINQMAGLDVQQDFIAQLGSQWLVYTDPASTGSGFGAAVVLNHPADPAKLEDSIGKLEIAVNKIIAERSRDARIEFREMDVNGVHLHYVDTPLASPSYAIKDGTLYFALYPQSVAAALSPTDSSKSILDNPEFQAARQTLGVPDQFIAFRFNDLPKTFSQNYATQLTVSRIFPGIGDLFGLQIPPLLLPPLNKILPELEPAASFAWFDGNAVRVRGVTPFPGAAAMTSQSYISVGATAMMASIMLPALTRARGAANQVKCASNLRQIGEGCLLYANDNHGSLPPTLGDLIKTEDLTIQVFVCPATNTTPPQGLTPDQAAAWINANSDYIYLGGGQKEANYQPDMVLAYEKEPYHPGGMNVLFGDGHVAFLPVQVAQQIIEKTKSNLGL